MTKLPLPAIIRRMGKSPRFRKELDRQGHRGARGLVPENTWPAFLKALDCGMTTLEFDTVLTADGVQIIHHDLTLNPHNCLDADGQPVPKTPINKLSMDYLKSLDCGSLVNPRFPEQIPAPGACILTLPEFFDRFREMENSQPQLRNIQFNIETKFPGHDHASEQELEHFSEIMCGNLQKTGYAGRTTVQSFVHQVLPMVKKRLPQLRTSALAGISQKTMFRMQLGLGAAERQDILASALAAGADIVSPHYLCCTAAFNRMAHEKGLLVIPWTVNETAEMKRQIEAGVDGLITDYPDRLQKVWQKAQQ
jgi:glycerophosphoryl diester phosphodiesterase